MKKILAYTAFLISLLWLCPGFISAQDVNPVKDADRFFPDFQADADMRAATPDRDYKNSGIQYGGWLTPVMIDQRNSDTSLTSSLTTAKVWAKSYIWDNNYVYVRLKDSFLWIAGQEGYSLDDTDNVFDLDVAFISMSFAGQSLRLSAGRKFYLLGSGLLFNGRGDGLEFQYVSSLASVKLFGAYTGLLAKDSNPYGLSDKDISDGAKRLFAGGTIERGINNQTLYLLGLAQVDNGDEDSGQKSRYQSQYFGLGIKGVAFKEMFYYAEAVYETGVSYLSGTSEESDIRAGAAIVGVDYYLDMALNPALIFQYAYGSGDSGRSDYRATGNTSGNDTGFISFGTFVGGYALNPVLANLHIARAGFSFTPMSWSERLYLKRMTLIMKYTLYLKDKKDSAINNQEAVLNERLVGHGADLALRWKIFYDLSAFVNYAVFIPGEAYDSSENNRHFTMLGLNLSF